MFARWCPHNPYNSKTFIDNYYHCLSIAMSATDVSKDFLHVHWRIISEIAVVILLLAVIYYYAHSCQKEAGAGCKNNSQCATRACGRMTAAKGDVKHCCDKTSKFAFFDYCSGMKKDDACWSNKMCASGKCAGNWGGLKRGKCT